MTQQKIIVATGNQGKLREIRRVLEHKGVDFISQKELNVEDAIEDGLTFVENAIIKARHAARITGLPALADDSGLEVDCLKGQPGIYSARFAGEDATDEDNNQKLLDELGSRLAEKPVARFHCVMVFMRHADDPTPIICQGAWEGYITGNLEGHYGFGYDPLFFVPSENCSAAQLDPDLKNRISHRGQALTQLVKALENTSFG